MSTVQMSYEEWLKANLKLKEEDYPYPECDGDGEVECYSCGHTNDCDACSGSGNSLYSEYQRQFAKEKRLIERGVFSR